MCVLMQTCYIVFGGIGAGVAIIVFLTLKDAKPNKAAEGMKHEVTVAAFTACVCVCEAERAAGCAVMCFSVCSFSVKTLCRTRRFVRCYSTG